MGAAIEKYMNFVFTHSVNHRMYYKFRGWKIQAKLLLNYSSPSNFIRLKGQRNISQLCELNERWWMHFDVDVYKMMNDFRRRTAGLEFPPEVPRLAGFPRLITSTVVVNCAQVKPARRAVCEFCDSMPRVSARRRAAPATQSRGSSSRDWRDSHYSVSRYLRDSGGMSSGVMKCTYS